MKNYKQTDLLLQIAALIFSLVVIPLFASNNYIYGYFLVGGIQVISVALHVFFRIPGQDNQLRKPYYIALWVIAASVLLMFLFIEYGGMLIAMSWLFITPIMAFYYCYTCYREWKQLNRRPAGAINIIQST